MNSLKNSKNNIKLVMMLTKLMIVNLKNLLNFMKNVEEI